MLKQKREGVYSEKEVVKARRQKAIVGGELLARGKS